MTINEASVKFQLDEKEVRKRYKDGMILNVRTEKRKIQIPENTTIIPSKKDIQSFLFQIIKYKNNPTHIIDRGLCPDDTSLHCVMDYLNKRGFIGTYSTAGRPNLLDFSNIGLTDTGFQFMLGNSANQKLVNLSFSALTVNTNLKFSGISIG